MRVNITNDEQLEVYIDDQLAYEHPKPVAPAEPEPMPEPSGEPKLTYLGNFTAGVPRSRIIAVSEDGNSLFAVLDGKLPLIGEYKLPAEFTHHDSHLDVPELEPIQAPVPLLGENYERFDPQLPKNHRFRVTGMYHKGGKLIVNFCDFYNATSNPQPHTTFVVRDASDLANSPIDGSFKFDTTSQPAGAMISIPAESQNLFDGDLLSFCARSIGKTRQLGPASMPFYFSDVATEVPADRETPHIIGNDMLMSFPFDKGDDELRVYYDRALWDSIEFENIPDKLYAIRMNEKHFTPDGRETATLWSRRSKTVTGCILPEYDTLMTFSALEGATRKPYYTQAENQPDPVAGVLYKEPEWRYNPDTNRYEQSGKSPGNRRAIQDDCYTSVMLFKLSDLERVKAGLMKPWDIRHYKKIELKANTTTTRAANEGIHSMVDTGAYDAANGLLYLGYRRQVRNERLLVEVYKVS